MSPPLPPPPGKAMVWREPSVRWGEFASWLFTCCDLMGVFTPLQWEPWRTGWLAPRTGTGLLEPWAFLT